MLEIKARKMGMALLCYCKSYKHYDYVMPSLMANSMVFFLLKHPNLLQEPKYKHLYDKLLEFQIEDAYLSFCEFDYEWVNSFDYDTLKGAIEMVNDTELHDENSNVYKLELSDINEFISDYIY